MKVTRHDDCWTSPPLTASHRRRQRTVGATAWILPLTTTERTKPHVTEAHSQRHGRSGKSRLNVDVAVNRKVYIIRRCSPRRMIYTTARPSAPFTACRSFTVHLRRTHSPHRAQRAAAGINFFPGTNADVPKRRARQNGAAITLRIRYATTCETASFDCHPNASSTYESRCDTQRPVTEPSPAALAYTTR